MGKFVCVCSYLYYTFARTFFRYNKLLYHVNISRYTVISQQLTFGWYAQNDSTAAPNAVGGHNTDSVSHIVGYSYWNTGSDWTEARIDSDGVVDWSPTIILWGLPLHCEGHTVLTILLSSGGGSPGRRGETC